MTQKNQMNAKYKFMKLNNCRINMSPTDVMLEQHKKFDKKANEYFNLNIQNMIDKR